MRRRDILIGIVIVALALLAAFWIRKAKLNKERSLQVETPTAEERIKEAFNGFTVPDDAEKVDLKDVSGSGGAGIATRTEVLADLPGLTDGSYYQVWQEKNGKIALLGTMRVAKGGYLFEGSITGEKVIVSLEAKLDSKMEAKILEGSF